MHDEISQRTLYVGGLDDNVTYEILNAAFVPFGDLRSVEIPRDRGTGKHRGFGFVEFEEVDDAAMAVKNMDGAEIYGRVLTVNVARHTASKRYTDYNKPVWSEDFYIRKQKAEEATQLD